MEQIAASTWVAGSNFWPTFKLIRDLRAPPTWRLFGHILGHHNCCSCSYHNFYRSLFSLNRIIFESCKNIFPWRPIFSLTLLLAQKSGPICILILLEFFMTAPNWKLSLISNTYEREFPNSSFSNEAQYHADASELPSMTISTLLPRPLLRKYAPQHHEPTSNSTTLFSTSLPTWGNAIDSSVFSSINLITIRRFKFVLSH